MIKTRILEKMLRIEKLLKNFELWSTDALCDEKTKLACFKLIQETGECAMDILALILRHKKEIPKDDYTNIDSAERLGIFPHNVAEILKELNGLRNRVVHEYNGINDKLAIESFKDMLAGIKEFLSVIKNVAD